MGSLHERSVCILNPRQVKPGLEESALSSYQQLQEWWKATPPDQFSSCDDPLLADIVLLPVRGPAIGRYYEGVFSWNLFNRLRERLVLYTADDEAYPAIKGIYADARTLAVRLGWAEAGPYISAHIHRFRFPRDAGRNRKNLFSFVGSSRTHPLRQRILALPGDDAFLFDSSSKDEPYWWEKTEHERLMEQYRQVMLNSRMVLCPRGVARSSLRLFEAMEAGAVPVIVSDRIVLPQGPDWAKCSLKVRERDVEQIPELLRKIDPRSHEMGARARTEWERHFSEKGCLLNLLRRARELVDRNRGLRGCILALLVQSGKYVSRRYLKERFRRQLCSRKRVDPNAPYK